MKILSSFVPPPCRSRLRLLSWLLCCAAFTPANMRAAPGDVDTTFNVNSAPSNFNQGSSITIQPDEKLLLAGIISSIGGQARKGAARVNKDGSLESGLSVLTLTAGTPIVGGFGLLEDRKFYLGGQFANLAATSRRNWARMNADGAIDSSFTLDADSGGGSSSMGGFFVQADGKVVCTGQFSNFGGLARRDIARLNADGTVDTGFNYVQNRTQFTALRSMDPLPDGKFIVSDVYLTAAGSQRIDVLRLNANGTPDPTFTPHPVGDGFGYVVRALPDGKILLAGDRLHGIFANSMIRLNADGSHDTSFVCDPILKVCRGLELQADGKILAFGDVPAVIIANGNGPGVVRLLPNGTLDLSFRVVRQQPSSVGLDGNGRVLMAGRLTPVPSIGDVTPYHFARLRNDAAPQTLTFTSSRVEWLRGGTSPEAYYVKFESSADSGATWTPLGAGTRIAGGWELTGLSLAAGVQVRALARTMSGLIDSSRITEWPAEVAVLQPLATELVDGGSTIAFATTYTDETSAAKSIVITNYGTAPLNVTGITVSGLHAADFVVTAPTLPVALGAEQTITVSVAMAPSAVGLRTGTLQIMTDDADEATFDVALTGSGKLHPDGPPEFPAQAASATYDEEFTYQIQATDEPTSYTATGLPSGLFLVTATGVISGFPGTFGSHTVTLGATNSFGTGSGTMVITIINPHDVLREPLDNATANFTRDSFNPNGADWFGQTVVSHDGVDAAQSGPITHNGQTDIRMTITGPATLSFWWKTDCEAGRDEFYYEGLFGQRIIRSGPNTPWEKVVQNFPAGTHSLRWLYIKNSSINVGADAVWLDEVTVQPPDSAPEIVSVLTASGTVPNSFTYQIQATDVPSSYAATGLPPGLFVNSSNGSISGTPSASGVYPVQISASNSFGSGPAVTLVITVTNPGDVLRDALDYSAGNFQAPGAAPWFSQTAISHDGVDAARSGVIGNFGQVSFTAAITGPAIASWWWRTDCEATNDYLRATLDFVEKGRISGVAGAWARVEIPIPGGAHTLQFTYQKNGSINSGADAGWVDEVTITYPAAPEIAVEQPADTDLPDGTASVAFGTVNTGSSSATQTFTIKNTGSGALGVTGIATSGGNSGDFTVSSPALPLVVAAAGSTTFTVTFTPTAAGARTTTLQILSADANEGTFNITLTGSGNISPDGDNDNDSLPDAWEITHFGSARAVIDTDDADGDGLNNFGEYAFGLNPNRGDLGGLPQPTLTGGLLTLTVTKQPHVVYTMVASTDLSAGSFSNAGLTIVTDNATTLTVRETAAGTRRFMQIRAVPAP